MSASVWPSLTERLAALRLLAFDVDGVLTDGRLWYGPDGEQLKAFHVHDGLGLKRLQAAGIELAIISARGSAALRARAAELGIAALFERVADKGECLARLAAAQRLPKQAVGYMGDDLPDLPALAVAGLRAAPANARAEVLAVADWVASRVGGHGAVREFSDAILAARRTLLLASDDRHA